MLYVNNGFSQLCSLPGADNKGATDELDNLNVLPEATVWNAFRNGNDKVFTWLYETYSSMLFEYGCRLTGDKELVGDCLQDFYLYLREKGSGFGETNAIKPYLLKSFRRRIVECIKKKQVRVSLDARLDFMQNSEPCIEARSIYKEIKIAQLEKLSKALKALNPVEREAIYYFYYKGLGYEKIAEIFKFSHVSSARRVMYRSLKQLRHSLQQSS